MKKIEYHIHQGDNEPKKLVEGYQLDQYFAVRKVGKYWQIDHIPTGMFLGKQFVKTRKEMVRRFDLMQKAVFEVNPCHTWEYDHWRDLLHRGNNKGYGHEVFTAARKALM